MSRSILARISSQLLDRSAGRLVFGAVYSHAHATTSQAVATDCTQFGSEDATRTTEADSLESVPAPGGVRWYSTAKVRAELVLCIFCTYTHTTLQRLTEHCIQSHGNNDQTLM